MVIREERHGIVQYCVVKTLLVLLALAAPAAAEINQADSIEWQTVDADLVVRGFVGSVKKSGGVFETTFQITESIKGGRKQTVLILMTEDPARFAKEKTDLLLFLDQADGVVSVHPSNVSSVSVFELGKHIAYTADFDALVKPTEVLAAARRGARSKATAGETVDVPGDTAAYQKLWSGSAVGLTVPADAALEKRAHALLAGPYNRVRGARMLRHFRSPKNIAILKKLLTDPEAARITETGKPVMRAYLLRRIAHETLTAWHVAHAKPVLEEPEQP